MSNTATLEKTIHRSGSTLHYWLTGPEDGPPVIFTHGATMDYRMFDAQVGAVAVKGYRVLAWDIRGHGRSKPIGDGFSLGRATDDLVAILDGVGFREAVHVGQSFGGFVAQDLTYRHPERVRALVLIGSSSITTPPNRQEQLTLKLTPTLFKLWPAEDFRRLVAKNTAVKPEVQAYAQQAIGAISREEFLDIWEGVRSSLREEESYRTGKPLLLTHGDHDWIGNIAKAAPEWAAREPDCHYEVIPGAGHNANQDNPEFFNRLLLDFLKQRAPVRAV